MNWSNLDQPNNGLLFNKSIYVERGILNKLSLTEGGLKLHTEESDFEKYYNKLYQQTTANLQPLRPESTNQNPFYLYTTYPGLLTGSGYQHDTAAKGDFKIGFYFDHTTGQPVIPGSSIKGVIRSVFNADGNEARALAALHFILDELKLSEKARNDRWDRYKQNITAETLETLDKEIFGEQEDGGSVIFYDAFIQPNFSQSIHFLTNDFLTPHRNPLKNPIPLMFLKILPNIAFQFDFNFSNYSPNGIMPSEDLREVFKQIILTLGLGAKTNVGYGQFSLSAMIESADGDSEQLQPENVERIIDKLTVASEDLQQKLIIGSEWDAEIVEIDKKKRAIILLSAHGEEVKMKKRVDRIKKGEEAKVGLKLRIIFNADYNPNEPNFSIIEIIE